MSDRATLKSFFESGDFPTQAQFGDFIDQTLNIADDGAGAVGLRVADVSVSSAELLAIKTTPKIIVAAPGANKVIVPVFALGIYTFVSTAYDTGGQFLGLFQTDDTGLNWLNFQSGFTPILTLVASVNRAVLVASSPADFLLNKALVLTQPSADPTLGDSTFRVIVLHREFTI